MTAKRNPHVSEDTLNSIVKRAHYLATQMVYQANHRGDKQKGDPKVGGHASAAASSIHISGALHLLVKTGFDFIVSKPHASPTDHAYNYLLDLLLKQNHSRLSLEEANEAMLGLRKFSTEGQTVFQSYHSALDPDHHNVLPTGTVGIPPVNAGYLALAYRYAKDHDYKVPDAHFWAIGGDSEFREGSLFEALPEFAERQIGNLTWILDYNRQSLDGHRITNHKIMDGSDNDRIEKTFKANGWHVIQIRHGQKRLAAFKRPDGELFKNFLEKELLDYELQSLLLIKDMKALKKGITKSYPKLNNFLNGLTDEEFHLILRDLGGHDIEMLAKAMLETKKVTDRPSLIIAHTVKGWGLNTEAVPNNHNIIPDQEDVERLKKEQGLSSETLFARFDKNSSEQLFLMQRSQSLYSETLKQEELKIENKKFFAKLFDELGPIPTEVGINLKMASYPHTQWMLGQINAKLNRCANTPYGTGAQLPDGFKPLNPSEAAWKHPSELMVAMAPDVGTSTNLNSLMDGKIFGVPITSDYEKTHGVKDSKTPDLVPGQDPADRFIRFEIAEANTMSCMGSFGKMRDIIGVPILPLMTVYDFFIKRALDQHFYNIYWKSSFILVGTPAGVTLSPEGAQHGWKSDFQIPNQITWEPYFAIELDWILSDAIKRHMLDDNYGRSGVHIRCVTRGVEQKNLLRHLKTQLRFKSTNDVLLHPTGFEISGAQDQSLVPPLSDEMILEQLRHSVLKGAYYLIDYRGYANYSPGDNVVNIFALGALTTEAVAASEKLLQKGIYANIICVTSTDLLLGNLAHENDYSYLTKELGINGHLFFKAERTADARELKLIAGRRTPIISVHDGEPGLLDNLGSVVGVKQISLAVRKHSRCGLPKDVYEFHHIDEDSVVEACLKGLEMTSEEEIILR